MQRLAAKLAMVYHLTKIENRAIALVLCLLFFILLTYLLCSKQPEKPTNGLHKLSDIMKGPRFPTPGSTIFFHETSCFNNKTPSLNIRQALAVESAAKMNPNWDIFVLFATSVDQFNLTRFPGVIEALSTYSNVYFRTVDLESYAQHTPSHDWLKEGKLHTSKFFTSHLSDYLRFLSLYKWSGVYLDLDVIVRIDLADLEQNFAGAESWAYVAAGIISLDEKEPGRRFAKLFLEEFWQNFNGQDWGYNGPKLLTRVLQKQCGTTDLQKMTSEICHGFRVFPMKFCYAIEYFHWSMFFDPAKTQQVLEKLSKSYIVHFWNKLSEQRSVIKGDRSTYDLLAGSYCPKVYDVIEDKF